MKIVFFEYRDLNGQWRPLWIELDEPGRRRRQVVLSAVGAFVLWCGAMVANLYVPQLVPIWASFPLVVIVGAGLYLVMKIDEADSLQKLKREEANDGDGTS